MSAAYRGLWRLLTLTGVVALMLGCRDSPNQPGRTPVGLEIEAPTRAIWAGGTVQLAAIADFADGTTADVTAKARWSIDPGHAGSIQPDGVFVATIDSLGAETIRADYEGQAAMTQIEVTKRARTLSIWPVSTSVPAGAIIQFEAIAEFQDVTQAYVTGQVVWSVTPGTAGTIDSTGLFRATAGGTGREVVSGRYQTLTCQSEIEVDGASQPAIEMVTIPSGSFVMGDDAGSTNEQPAHEVNLDAFEIGRYEVTNEQYAGYLNQALSAGEILVGSGIVTGRKGPFAGIVYSRYLGSPAFPDTFIEYVEVEAGSFRFQAKAGHGTYPAVRLNWYGAAAFCSFYGYRLPTEAEWEKACRGGQQLDYGTEDGSISHDLANYRDVGGRDSFEGVAPVGSFPPNRYGLYDMSGNAGEYVFDLYDADYYQDSPGENPIGPGPAMPVGELPGGVALWRGGSWILPPQYCRSAFRGIMPDQADHNEPGQAFVGFRVARSLP